MTNTENGSAADKPAGKKASTASEPTTVTTTPQTTVVERRGVSGGVLIGAIGAALAGGLLLGRGTGALITHIAESGDRLSQGQVRPGQLDGISGQHGMPGQQQGGGPPGGPHGHHPRGPHHRQDGPGQQQDDDSETETLEPDSGTDD